MDKRQELYNGDAITPKEKEDKAKILVYNELMLDRQEEIERVGRILNYASFIINELSISEYLVDSGIRSKEGFEIDCSDCEEGQRGTIEPIDYGEDNG